jgi:hypothetical protein
VPEVQIVWGRVHGCFRDRTMCCAGELRTWGAYNGRKGARMFQNSAVLCREGEGLGGLKSVCSASNMQAKGSSLKFLFRDSFDTVFISGSMPARID